MLKEKIEADFKEALKSGREIEVLALRMLKAAILNKEKEKRYKLSKDYYPAKDGASRFAGRPRVPIVLPAEGGAPKPELSGEELEKESQLVDDEVIEVVLTEVKKRREAILEFEKGKREDLAVKEKKEMETLQKYLPEQLSEEELQKLAKETIEKVGATKPKDMGKVMAELMPKIKGKADGGLVSKIVKELLSSAKS